MALEVAIASGAIALDGDMAFPADIASGAMALEGAIASGAMELDVAIASADIASVGGHAVEAMASAAYAVPAIDIVSAIAEAARTEEIFMGSPLIVTRMT